MPGETSFHLQHKNLFDGTFAALKFLLYYPHAILFSRTYFCGVV